MREPAWPIAVLLPYRSYVWWGLGALAMLGFVAIVFEQALLFVDRPLAAGLRRHDDWQPFFRGVTQAGSQQVGVVVALVLAVLLRRWCPTLASAVPLAVASGIVADVGLKLVVDRPRPADSLTGTSLGSFPSGHVIHAVVLLGMLPPAAYLVSGSRRVWKLTVGAVVVTVVGVALSRVYLGAHWPSDTLAGAALGGLILVAVYSYVARRPCRGCRLHLRSVTS